MEEALQLIDEHYIYFEVPFQIGSLLNPANENIASAKLLSFGLMTKMTAEQVVGIMFRGSALSEGDAANLAELKKTGWDNVKFETGLAICSKLQAGDDTETVFDTQAKLSGEASWEFESDSWIP